MVRRRRGWSTFRWSLALGLAHAALFAPAFPSIYAWPLVFVAIMPLVVIALKTERPARSAFAVWLATAPMWLLLERWLASVTVVGYVLTVMYLALYPALFVWIGAKLARRVRSPWFAAAALAAVWIGLETLRGEVVFNGYAWFLIAHPLIDIPIAQLAQWIGVYGVGLLVVFPQTLVVVALLRRRSPSSWIAPATIAAGVIGAAMLGGMMIAREQPRQARQFSIAVVQTNVPQSNKIGWSIEQRVKDFARFRELTIAAAGGAPADQPDDGQDASPVRRRKPDLIVWPETMFPGDTLSPAAVEAMRDAGLRYQGGMSATAFFDALLALQREIDTPMLVGAIGYKNLRITVTGAGEIEFDDDGKYNSAFLLENGAVAPLRYDKLHLTPFGEVLPYISWSDRLEQMLRSLGAPGMLFDLDAGDRPVVFDIPLREGQRATESVRIVTPICFEAATPAVCRRLVFFGAQRRADLMVNLTNDGWFGDSIAGHEQHLQVARWRTIELRTPMVRAANTGISAAIDTLGRVQLIRPKDRKQSVNTDGALRETVRLGSGGATVYARVGDVVGWLTLAFTGGTLLVVFSAGLKRIHSRSGSGAH